MVSEGSQLQLAESGGTALERLKIGLILRYIDQETDEPQNYVLNQSSQTVALLKRQSEYAHEVFRVLGELKMTIALMQAAAAEDSSPNPIAEPEELILYYQGIFLHLTHQLKDKMLRMINFITTNDEDVKQVKDALRDDDIKLAEFLSARKDILDNIGIATHLEAWNQTSNTGIGVALRKRTQYHHRLSRLPLDESFQRYQLAKILLAPNGTPLSEYGKTYVPKLRDESFLAWHTGVMGKAQTTLNEMENNLETIATALIKHYSLPDPPTHRDRISRKLTSMLESFEVRNEASLTNTPPEFLDSIREIISSEEVLRDTIEAIYLVGSLPRGEFEPLFSDVNLHVILRDGEGLNGEVHRLLLKAKDGLGRLDINIITKQAFLAQTTIAQKQRFICWADGILIYGDDVIRNETFPKAGMHLSILLNSDLPDDIAHFEAWVRENPNANEESIGSKSREVVKRTIDYLFGIAMASKPYFTSSRQKRIAHILEVFPHNEQSVLTLSGLLRSKGVRTLREIGYLIDNLKSNIKALTDMQKIKSEIEGKALMA